MRKHEEGYALVLVLVVLTVISLVAVGLMSFSLSNLQNQRNAVDWLQEQYTAEGEIEKYLLKLERAVVELEPEEETLGGMGQTILKAEALDPGELHVQIHKNEDSIVVVSISGTTQVSCKIVFLAASANLDVDGESYILKSCTGISCRSYEISRGVAQE